MNIFKMVISTEKDLYQHLFLYRYTRDRGINLRK